MTESRRSKDARPARSSYLTDSRSRASRQSAAANDGAGLVLVPLADLLDAIRDAVGEANTGAREPGSRLNDRVELAERMSCSPATVDKMRRDGMPCLYVGDSPRFVFEDCVRWMGEQRR